MTFEFMQHNFTSDTDKADIHDVRRTCPSFFTVYLHAIYGRKLFNKVILKFIHPFRFFIEILRNNRE